MTLLCVWLELQLRRASLLARRGGPGRLAGQRRLGGGGSQRTRWYWGHLSSRAGACRVACCRRVVGGVCNLKRVPAGVVAGGAVRHVPAITGPSTGVVLVVRIAMPVAGESA